MVRIQNPRYSDSDTKDNSQLTHRYRQFEKLLFLVTRDQATVLNTENC